ncbi:MAG: hypothetical protein WC478_01355 [Candidatus Omnitrophota bacterium]
MIKKISAWALRQPGWQDAFILCLFTAVITAQPYLFHQTLNLFELGIYLPGIDGILHGQLPYRDFFYLRGPLELYIPALMMRFFGEHLGVLSAYFYLGTVVTLIAAVLIAWQLIPARLFLYCLVPVLVGRTFPRVVFSYWGGMRYGWGLLAVLFLILFINKKRGRWIFGAGVLTAVAGLTSLEIGVSVFLAGMASALFARRERARAMFAYAAGIAIAALPILVYLASQGAWTNYLNDHWVIATQMAKMQLFLRTEITPTSPGQFFFALVNIAGKNFRQMTPFYCYLAFVVYLFWRRRKAGWDIPDQAAAALSIYGLMLYFTAFRTLWQSVFEMALQPEKIILFYLVSRAGLFFIAQKKLKIISWLFIVAIIGSSLGYSIPRFSKRFSVFWKDPFENKACARMDLARVKGMVLPDYQAQDFHLLQVFLDKHTQTRETVWMYPELGSLHFILQRPWVGRFPTATMAWFDDAWQDGYMRELRRLRPGYAVFERKSPQHFSQPCYSVKAKELFREQFDYLQRNYTVAASTPSYDIYVRKDGNK